MTDSYSRLLVQERGTLQARWRLVHGQLLGLNVLRLLAGRSLSKS
jgi:hypothetical protein